MPIKPEARHRLAELMDERRLELGLRWQDVAEAGDISLKTLHSARTGTEGIAGLSRRKIEAGLRWQPGSIDRILDGGEPEPLPVALPPISPDDPQYLPATEEHERAMQPHLARLGIKVGMAMAGLKPGERLPGARLFPGDDTAAQAWDAQLTAGISPSAAVRVMASLFALREEAAAERRGRAIGLIRA